MAKWLEEIAKSKIISQLNEFCSALNARAAAAEKINPSVSKSKFYAFDPPSKEDLPQFCCLDTKQLRDAHMGVRSSYAWSFKDNKGIVLSRHPLAAEPRDKFIRPRFLQKDPEDVKKEWRKAYRKNEPEKSGIVLGTLSKVWKELKGLGLVLAPRRKPWKDKCADFERSAAHKREKDRSKREALLAKRAGKDMAKANESGLADSTSTSSCSSDSSSSVSSSS